MFYASNQRLFWLLELTSPLTTQQPLSQVQYISTTSPPHTFARIQWNTTVLYVLPATQAWMWSRNVCEPIVCDCYSSKSLLLHRCTVLYPNNFRSTIISAGVHGIQLGVSLFPKSRTTSRIFFLAHGDYLGTAYTFYPVSYLNKQIRHNWMSMDER